MVIVTTISFPTESANEMGDRFLKVSPLPDFLSRKGPFFSSSNTGGVNSLSVYELDNDKLAEGMTAVSEYITGFFGIPGFSYEVKVSLEVEESLKMIGLG
jgi:hypothetical protein